MPSRASALAASRQDASAEKDRGRAVTAVAPSIDLCQVHASPDERCGEYAELFINGPGPNSGGGLEHGYTNHEAWEEG
jgi:hypothetical protein